MRMKANAVQITMVTPAKMWSYNRIKEKITGLKGAHPSSPWSTHGIKLLYAEHVVLEIRLDRFVSEPDAIEGFFEGQAFNGAL